MNTARFCVWMLVLLGFMLMAVMLATRDFDGWLGKATVATFAVALAVSFFERRRAWKEWRESQASGEDSNSRWEPE